MQIRHAHAYWPRNHPASYCAEHRNEKKIPSGNALEWSEINRYLKSRYFDLYLYSIFLRSSWFCINERCRVKCKLSAKWLKIFLSRIKKFWTLKSLFKSKTMSFLQEWFFENEHKVKIAFDWFSTQCSLVLRKILLIIFKIDSHFSKWSKDL